MEKRETCRFCGDPIDVGQAWMRADLEGAEVRAHSACLYREERDPISAGWEPQDSSAE
jgi:ribosomal protein L24E